MKGLNVKRIAALAAGAAILGATLAYAGAVTYSNTPIISAAGVPQVKVVVGANAAASDGVAAANIAALIGNLAFKSQDITATVSGAANLACTVSGAGGAGTCAVSNEKVTFDVTLPGVVSGVYQFNTYINDWVDKKLENRIITGADDIYNTSVDLSPFETSPGVGTSNYAVKKVTATEFPALQSPTVTDPYANKQYTEEQSLWFQGLAQYDEQNHRLAATSPRGAYQITFTHDQSGIPVGTCDATSMTNLNTADQNASNVGDYTKCPDQDKTDRHRVHLGFLGDSYIISQMTPPTGCSDLNSSISDCSGGSINLAKESAYNTVHVGENLTAGAYVLKLQDIEAPMYGQTQAAASIAIYDSTGTLLKEEKYYPSTSSYTWTAPDGSKVRIKVYKTNPGYYAYAKWAEMAVYSQEFTLTDGSAINNDNDKWYVKLIWRNKDPTYASKAPDALRRIILYDNFADPTVSLGSGDTYDFIKTPVTYQVEFGGITLGSGDYDSLSMSLIYYSTPTFVVQTNFSATCSATGTLESLDGNMMRVSSLVKDAFQISGGGQTYTVQNYYYFLGNATGGSVIGIADGDVLYQKPGGSCYYNVSSPLIYYMAGDASSSDWGVAYAAHTNYTEGGVASIAFQEAASSTSGIYDVWLLPIYRDVDDYRDKFLLSTTSTARIYYAGTTALMGTEEPISPHYVEQYYISERGSKFEGVTTYGATISRARKLGELKFYVKSKGTNTTTGTTVGPLAEGESYNVGGGVTIKVNEITETVGTCTAGPNAQCTVTGKEGLTATPSVTMADVKVALNPASQPLVVLDKDADTSATLIVVGGNVVNTVAAAAMTDTSLKLDKSGDTIVKAIGTNRILVAGYNGADTTAAANQFIGELIAAAQ